MKIDSETYEHKGYSITIDIHHDEDMGDPWKEHDGHGIVSEWVRRDKKPGELVLCGGRGSQRFYDFAETMKLAKRDGWGLSDDAKKELARKLHRKPTAKQVLHASVMADFEHLRGWCNDEWCWTGYVTKITTPDGAKIDGGSCWGFDGLEYMLTEAKGEAESAIDAHLAETASEQTESFRMACADIATV